MDADVTVFPVPGGPYRGLMSARCKPKTNKQTDLDQAEMLLQNSLHCSRLRVIERREAINCDFGRHVALDKLWLNVVAKQAMVEEA